MGTYVLQFTTVADPDQFTPEGDWTDIAEFGYTAGAGTDDAPGGLFTEWLRHQYEIGVDGGGPIVATGVRIVIPEPHPPNDIAIDEIELYGAAAPATGPALRVSHDAVTGDLTISWDSRDGRLYKLRSEADPSVGDPISWPIFGGKREPGGHAAGKLVELSVAHRGRALLRGGGICGASRERLRRRLRERAGWLDDRDGAPAGNRLGAGAARQRRSPCSEQRGERLREPTSGRPMRMTPRSGFVRRRSI